MGPDGQAHNLRQSATMEEIVLAAESAWRVLRAEHARMRELLASIDQALRADEWRRPGPRLASLKKLILSLRTFDAATHRPKGVALLAVLRGRSPQVDGLLDKLAVDHEQCDRLLSQALLCLEAGEIGDEHAAAECASLLERHRTLMRSHLDCEDTLLHSHAAQLLTAEEWGAVVSSISSVIESGALRRTTGADR